MKAFGPLKFGDHVEEVSRAWGFPFGPSMRMRLLAGMCVMSLSSSNQIVALM
jgi:hypothetical protein